jgi:hypothetical protein
MRLPLGSAVTSSSSPAARCSGAHTTRSGRLPTPRHIISTARQTAVQRSQQQVRSSSTRSDALLACQPTLLAAPGGMGILQHSAPKPEQPTCRQRRSQRRCARGSSAPGRLLNARCRPPAIDRPARRRAGLSGLTPTRRWEQTVSGTRCRGSSVSSRE